LPWPTDVPEPISHPPLTDADSDGPAVIRWIERHCVYGVGDMFGEPVRLELFEKLFLVWLYEKRPDGRYRYRRALLEVPKGNGKSSLAAWVGLYQLAHQRSAVIPVCATSFDQADLIFSDMRDCVTQSPALSAVMTAFDAVIQVNNSPSKAFRVPAVGGVTEGLRITTAICDEIHELLSPSQRHVHDVLSNGCAKRPGTDTLMFNVTTPGYDLESVAGQLHTYGLRVNNGELDDPQFLMCWWGAEVDKFDLNTTAGLHAAIRAANPASDKFLSVTDIAARFHQTPLNQFIRYHLAGWTTAAATWLPAGAWDACADSSVTVPDGADIVIGFDGSHNNDSTAVVGVTCTPVPHVFVIDVWERDDTDQDWKVPIEAVEQSIRQACRRWTVREVVCDPFRWQRSMQILADEGLPVVEYPQTASRMTPSTQRLYEAALNGGLTHSGDPRLARHIANAVLKVDHRGQRLAKETTYSSRKIDLAVASVMAFDRAAAPVEDDDYDIMASVL
jgi:phage terminase large subunit-like protein